MRRLVLHPVANGRPTLHCEIVVRERVVRLLSTVRGSGAACAVRAAGYEVNSLRCQPPEGSSGLPAQ